MKLTTTIFTAICFCMVVQIHAQGTSWEEFNVLHAMSATDKGGGGTTTTSGGGSGGSGGGGNNNAIKMNWPRTGTMAMATTTLKWDKVGTAPYMVSISEGAKVVFSSTTTSNSLSIDLSSLDLKPGKDYEVKITDLPNVFKTNSAKVQFSSSDDLRILLEELEKDSTYMAATGTKKGLMKAFYLEENGWNYEASQAYNIPTDDKEEMIQIINMYNLFISKF